MFKGETLPEPESLLDFYPGKSGRTFEGQILEILTDRWIKATETKSNRYPGLPFETEGLDSIQTRKKLTKKFVKDFLRCAAAIDENIGKMLDYLKENDLEENTIVIYTADQGYFLGEHGMMDKRMFLESRLGCPL